MNCRSIVGSLVPAVVCSALLGAPGCSASADDTGSGVTPGQGARAAGGSGTASGNAPPIQIGGSSPDLGPIDPEPTNSGLKWWVWVLIGLGVAVVVVIVVVSVKKKKAKAAASAAAASQWDDWEDDDNTPDAGEKDAASVGAGGKEE